jgi:hypothetical protein
MYVSSIFYLSPSKFEFNIHNRKGIDGNINTLYYLPQALCKNFVLTLIVCSLTTLILLGNFSKVRIYSKPRLYIKTSIYYQKFCVKKHLWNSLLCILVLSIWKWHVPLLLLIKVDCFGDNENSQFFFFTNLSQKSRYAICISCTVQMSSWTDAA